MGAHIVKVKAAGKYSSPNEFSSIPDGSLFEAKNVVIDDNNVIEQRRGFANGFQLPRGTDRCKRIFFYENKPILAYSDEKVGYYDGSAFNEYSGDYLNPNDELARIRFLNAAGNCYFTTASGIYKLDSLTGTPAKAGMPRGLDIELSLSGSSGFLTNNYAVAYRIVWGITDNNNNLIRGAPSGRAEIYNTAGGSRDVQVVSTIPDGITTNHFYQIFRSKITDNSSTTIVPDDELGLVYEANPTSSEITNGYISFIDITDDSLRGETIYTAPSQQGIRNANDEPPLAWDINSFYNQTVLANIQSKYRLKITIVATGGTNGIAVDDTLTINGVVYTAKSSETISSGYFKVFTGGTPAQDIADTAKSLIRVINRYSSNTEIYASYLSGQTDLPGQILLEERSIGGSGFSITASAHPTAYNPNIPSSGTTVSATNDDFQHYIAFSKYEEHEAFPLLNTKPVGSKNDKLLRVFPLKNSLFGFKETEGLFRTTSSDLTNAEFELFDSSVRLLAPESISVVNNAIHCLTDQGIARITESGVSILSRPIEAELLDPTGSARDQIKQYSLGVGYETERKYILWAAQFSSDAQASTAHVFNVFTNAYTEWPISALAAAVHPNDDKLYYAPHNSNYIRIERKNKNRTDFVDEELSAAIASSSGTSVILETAEGIDAGDLLYQSSSKLSVINSVDLTTNTVIVDNTVDWSVGAVTIYKSIPVEVEWAPVFGENPGTLKNYGDFVFIFRKATFPRASVFFSTDLSPVFEEVPISDSSVTTGWGLGGWGTSGWGGASAPHAVETLVPLDKAYGRWLKVKFTHRIAYNEFSLLGFAMPIEDSEAYMVNL